jgi:hypothetical protein
VRSRAGYWIGGGLIAAGVVGAVLWFVLSLVNLNNEVDDFQRVPVPGEGTVQLEARKYVIYFEGPNADEAVPRFEIAITETDTERALAIDTYGGSLTYSFGREGSAQATITPPRAGSYAVRTSGADGTPGAQVAFGRSIAGSILRSILGVFAIGGVVSGAGVVLLVVTIVRRRRARTAAAATATPAAPTWPP